MPSSTNDQAEIDRIRIDMAIALAEREEQDRVRAYDRPLEDVDWRADLIMTNPVMLTLGAAAVLSEARKELAGPIDRAKDWSSRQWDKLKLLAQSVLPHER